MKTGTFYTIGDIDSINEKTEDILKTHGSFPGEVEVKDRVITRIEIDKETMLQAKVTYLVK